MIGCASHPSNLAIRLYLLPQENHLPKVNELLKKLQTLKQCAIFRKSTVLSPVTRNVTRWLSAFEMLKRYFEIRPMINYSSVELASLLPNATDSLMAETILRDMKKYQSITLKLQPEEIDISHVRICFDAVIRDIPALSKYRAEKAGIVKSPDFERALT